MRGNRAGSTTRFTAWTLLCLAYTDNICTLLDSEKATAFSYADDVVVVLGHNELEAAEQILQQKIDVLVRSSHDKSLVLNPIKTKVIHIRSPHYKLHDPHLTTHTPQCIHEDQTFGHFCNCPPNIETLFPRLNIQGCILMPDSNGMSTLKN